MMRIRQSLRFLRSGDGVGLAVATNGHGSPIVRAAHWLSHVEDDAASPVWAPWLEALGRIATYVRYDQRGCGLSDRDVADVSLDRMVDDLAAVIDGLELERPVLLGMSQGGAIAVRYAARHPDRVAGLVLLGAYARGLRARGGGAEADREAETLNRPAWPCCAKPVWDSHWEYSDIAGRHVQARAHSLPHPELVRLQRRAA